MTISITPMLKKVLYLDAAMSGTAGVLMVAGSAVLAPLLEIPAGLLFWAGLALAPFVALLVFTARSAEISRLMLFDIVLVNALWVVASFAIMLAGFVQPNVFGIAFISIQALAVAGLTALQVAGLRALSQAHA